MYANKVSLLLLATLSCFSICYAFPSGSNSTTPKPDHSTLVHHSQQQNHIPMGSVSSSPASNIVIRPKVETSSSLSKHDSPTTQNPHNSSSENTPRIDGHKQDGNGTESNSTLITVIVDSVDQDSTHSVGVDNTENTNIQEDEISSVVLVKTVRMNKVEEVFEDVMTQNVRRVITEDREEKTEIIHRSRFDESGSMIEFKNLISM